MTMRHLTAAVLGLALLTALAGCGRKGDLELPPGADTAKAEPAETAPAATPPEELPIDLQPLDEEMDDISPRGFRNY